MSVFLGTKRWRENFAWFVLVAMMASLFPIALALAQQPVAGSVSAITIAAYTGVEPEDTLIGNPAALNVGDTFAAWVKVDDAQNLQGVDLQLEFSPAVLQVVFFRHLGRNVPLLVPGPISEIVGDPDTVNNQVGLVTYGASNERAAKYPDGTALLKIGFKVIGEGDAFIRFKDIEDNPGLTDGAANIMNLTAVPISSLAFRVGVVVVPEPILISGVTLMPETATIDVGDILQLDATVEPENATNQELIWSSDNEEVATVDANGLVTSVGVGTATITVTTLDGEFKDTCVVTVEEAVAEVVYGDLNGDGQVTSADATLVLRHAAQIIDLTTQIKAADVNGDTMITAADATLILRYAVELIDKFPVEQST